MSEGLEYSSSALGNRVDFLLGNEPIILYVEDREKEYLYQGILKQLYRGRERNIIENVKIIGVGNKNLVKQKYMECNIVSKDSLQHYIYFMDGDFDKLIAPEEMIDNENVIYLEPYCIESCFLNEEACIDFIQGKIHDKDEAIRARLDFSSWKDEIINTSKELFFGYACLVQFANKYPEIPVPPNVSKAHELLNKSNGKLKNDKALERISDIKNIIDDYDERVNVIKERYEQLHQTNYFYLICGKYMLCSLAAHIRDVFGNNKIGPDQLIEVLRKVVDCSYLQPLKECIDKELIALNIDI